MGAERNASRLSIRQRLLARLLPLLAVLTGLWAWSTYVSVLRFADLAYDRTLFDTARTLATQIKVQDGAAVLDLSQDERDMLEVDPQDSVYFEVVDAAGRRLGGNRSLPAPSPEPPPSESGYFYDRVVQGEALRLVEHRIGKAAPGDLIVRVAETRRKRTRLATEALLTIAPLLGAFIAVTLGLVWWSVGRGFRPLVIMRDAIARRHHGDLSPLSSDGLPAELRSQVEVINELMARLSQVLETERRFLADATHQLRTPITVLRTQTELALRAQDLPALRAHLDKLDGASQRLTRLANQLLNLSRAEAGLEGLGEVGPVDLNELLEDVLDAHEPLAHAKLQKLELRACPDPLWLRGSPRMLTEMLANLVDNAVRYTPQGGRIEVEARLDSGSVQVCVRDDGPGIAEPERQKVMSRFYRGADTTEPGSGLGLSIVREIVRAHGGRFLLSPAQADGRGLLARVELPHSSA